MILDVRKQGFITSICFIYILCAFQMVFARDYEFKIKDAVWDNRKERLTISGRGRNGQIVTVYDMNDAVIGSDDIERGRWRIRRNLDRVPCHITAQQSDGRSDEKDVENKPDNCDDGSGGGGENNAPVAVADNYQITKNQLLTIAAPGVLGNDSDVEGDRLIAALHSNVSNGSLILNDDGSFSYTPDLNFNGQDSFTYQAVDTLSALSSAVSVIINVVNVETASVSINSTSRNGLLVGSSVSEQAVSSTNNYQIFGTNDLGMHCGDFDTRISSILPPFNVLHAQVIQRGNEPKILGPDDNVVVRYSAASNANDPILSGINSSGNGAVLSSVVNGLVFKTNFWGVAREAYDPFYPAGILPVFYPPGENIQDLGLPMPNTERLWLGDGVLTAEQQSMPGRFNPFNENVPQDFNLYTIDQPFFINFPFGYTSYDVNWFEAAGVPITAFDDAGRENPWPLYRFQAHKDGSVIASTDVVLPISGEANCGFCHNAVVDGGNGVATEALGENVATVLDDPEYDLSVPLEVSKEYAADINLVRLHDLKHNTDLENNTPVVCQSCHYTPALDLAQVGPSDANGRQQTNVRSMSNVMHRHHGGIKVADNDDGTISVAASGGRDLFPVMPPPVNRNSLMARNTLMDTCYQCHPGRRTDCLRGAMANGGMLCQDCHGDMQQVGDDFSRGVNPENPGAFELAADFYTNPDTPRVPWANEPGCGSCHTGDAMDNMHDDSGTIGDPDDGIRLMQAYLSDDPKATPIVPTNKRFAENTVANTEPGAGNPMLYRVSKGHEDVFCEACHGATHGIWPNKNPNANDNVTAMQLQGHTGTIAECEACHTGDLGANLDGPHGMHPIGRAGVKFAEGDHGSMVEHNPDACRACHGQNGEGTVLSSMAQARRLKCDDPTAYCPDGNSALFPNDYEVGCTECHSNEL
ncbi:MAG: cadherin-like domain-containing protein [gamma proteobacterium symbiont of Taylorina sp.]|nr:cadherin-like domain-containing protein [gamma proteobacterium symbiont of Taylorina sp.]